jgi:DNA modification methylase
MGSPRIRQLTYRKVSDLKPDPRNPRKHKRAQIEAIAKSIKAFGFNAPILVDRHDKVLAGHGRLDAAKLLGSEEVPVICLEDLSDAQARAYMIADNQLTDRSSWDDQVLAIHLQELSELALEFDIESTGFELPEIDLRIDSLNGAAEADDADNFEVASGPAVSRSGDKWLLGEHRLLCGSALEPASYAALMGGQLAATTITDVPYNLKISGNVSGLGAVKHREFQMASGEMARAEFTAFLTTVFSLAGANTVPGGIVDAFMDWRHMGEILAAGQANGFDLLNLCVWVKTNGGMGSFYRSKHELIFVFRNGNAPHKNNIQLGRFGRNRSNVWNYAGANIRPRKGREDPLALHPTVKPIMLVADAIRDSTARGDIVLDPCIGSGTTFLSAERTGQRGYGIELDPLYVDTAIARWQRMTGQEARHESGQTFAQLKAERSQVP